VRRGSGWRWAALALPSSLCWLKRPRYCVCALYLGLLWRLHDIILVAARSPSAFAVFMPGKLYRLLLAVTTSFLHWCDAILAPAGTLWRREGGATLNISLTASSHSSLLHTWAPSLSVTYRRLLLCVARSVCLWHMFSAVLVYLPSGGGAKRAAQRMKQRGGNWEDATGHAWLRDVNAAERGVACHRRGALPASSLTYGGCQPLAQRGGVPCGVAAGVRGSTATNGLLSAALVTGGLAAATLAKPPRLLRSLS